MKLTLTQPREELFKAWIDFQLTNPPKTNGVLERLNPSTSEVVGRCCLGNICSLLPELSRSSGHDQAKTRYNGNWSTLPVEVTERLNITQDGQFKSDEESASKINNAILYAAGLSNANHVPKSLMYRSLVDINDGTNLDHRQIGMIIETAFNYDLFLSRDNNQPEQD